MLESGVDTVGQMGGDSLWLTISMIALSLFLLAFAWALLRPSKSAPKQAETDAAERFARNEIDAPQFERIVRAIRSQRRPNPK